MLNLAKIQFALLITLLITSCYDHGGKKAESVSRQLIGVQEYFKLYSQVSDTVEMWTANQLGLNTFKKGEFEYQIDSLLCLNDSHDRLVTCILMQTVLQPSTSDGLIYLYGQNVNAKWYFVRGASIVIPRSMVKGQNVSKPLSYHQLHEIALHEVYRGYLDNLGNINEDWFKQHFEEPGMCGNCKTSEEFKKRFYVSAMAQWANRDTTQPIKRIEKRSLP